MNIKDTLERVLAEDQLPYDLLSGGDAMRVRALGKPEDYGVVAQWSDADEQLIVWVVSTRTVPPERRLAAMESITRANFGMRLGAFELDLDDGELRFRTSADFEGTKVSASMVRTLLYTGVAMMQRYLPAIVAVIGGAEPKRAISEAEARV